MRDHNPITIEEFNGFFKRGDIDSCPLDHFSDCNNIQYSESSFLTRYGIGPYLPYRNVVRIYPFNQSLLILDIDGNIYHSDRNPKSFVPILHINGMTDFGCVKFANRVYITPIGMNDEFIYVYTYGDQNGARKAAGPAPTTAPGLSIGSAGNVEQGVHVFAVIYETDTGYLTQLSPKASITLPDGTTQVNVDLPISPNSYVRKRHVVASKAIDPADFTGNLDGYEFFFIPDATANNNTDTSITVNFYDADLLEDASYLEDLYDEIPNCAGLNSYHQRLVGWAIARGNGGERLSDIIVSFPNEPEAISQVDGLISLTRDGRPITYCQEFRDVMYVFKQVGTRACTDNGDVPSTWPISIIDNGIGATAHGVATIMDSGGVNVDYLMVSDFTGIVLFSGTYLNPELTWKVRDFWPNTDRTTFTKVQLVVNNQDHFIYTVLPDGTMLVGDYNNGLEFKSIKWTKWTFDVKVTTLTIIEDADRIRLVIGSKEAI